MKDSLFNVGDITLRVKYSESDGPAIVFVHGNSCSADFWDAQLADDRLNGFRLVAVDLPGHGGSEWAAAYGLGYLTDVLAQLISALKLSEYILVGISYSTALIAEAAPLLKQCLGFCFLSPNVTSDACPPTSYIVPFPALGVMIAENPKDTELAEFAFRLTLPDDRDLREKFFASYRQTDPLFRVQLGEAMMNRGWADEFKLLAGTGLPVTYLFGELDEILNIRYLDEMHLPENHSVEVISGAGHFINVDKPAVFRDTLMLFRQECLKSRVAKDRS